MCFIVPSSPTSGHRTLKLGGLNQWEHATCAADAQHAYSRDTVIPNVDPRYFPPGKAVTGCDDTHVAFAS
jgi:hypothetical protein